MEIKIEKEVYKNLRNEDKVILLFLNQSELFKDTILEARKKLGISADRFEIEEQGGMLFEQKDGKLKPYGSWYEARKRRQRVWERVVRQAERITKKFNLPARWQRYLESLILSSMITSLPEKISLQEYPDGKKHIVISDRLNSKKELVDWVNSNWRMIRLGLGISKDKRELVSVPRHKKFGYYKEIIVLRDKKGMKFSEVADILYKKYEEFRDEINEDSVKNIYHRFRKSFASLKLK